ncbi:histidine kinase [hydrothermal vent metagenome]|uniref:Histidine kinase n=1 Tax=hydrothermal vent metagenome TaxID=652676 RepID=A0A1W1BKL3_9ZZZZ
MKKLKNDIFLKIILIFIGVFSLLFLISYGLSKHFILSLSLSEEHLIEEILIAFNLVWLKISLVFFILMIVTYFILKTLRNRVYEDLDAVSEYIYEISENKNYEKVLKIKHYLEFLEIAIGLKNMTKRLVQKDKKSSKK